MGSATPPPAKPPVPGPPPGEAAVETPARSRYRLEDRKVPMGPSGTAILLVAAAVAVGAWLYLKPPGEIGPQALPRFAGYESSTEPVILRDCAPPGCAAVYLTPAADKASQDALPGALQLAGELEQQGLGCFIVFGEEAVKDAVKRARGLHRPVVFDPGGEWARASGIANAPYWIAWRTGGKIRLKSRQPVSAADVAAAIR